MGNVKALLLYNLVIYILVTSVWHAIYAKTGSLWSLCVFGLVFLFEVTGVRDRAAKDKSAPQSDST